MSPECGPWRTCDFHQYRSWLRRADSAPPNSTPTDKEKQKSKRPRRKPTAGDFQLTFRHHSDPAEYERDYLTHVTHARCRAANPSATLLATELTSLPPPVSTSDRTATQLPPPQPSPSAERRSAAVPSPAAAPVAAPEAVVRPLLDTASTPDLSADSATPPPRPTPPTSSPDLCRLPKIAVSSRAARRHSLPPNSSPAVSVPTAVSTSIATVSTSTAAYRRPVGQSSGRSVSQSSVQQTAVRQVRSVSVQREEGGQSAAAAAAATVVGGGLKCRRQQARQPRQPPTPHTVTLDLPSPLGFGCPAQARRSSHKPRGLTKIQLASSVPENLTIIVGRKLEISLSGAKRGRQRNKGFR